MKFIFLLTVLLTCNSFLLSAQEKSFKEALENINKNLETWKERGNRIRVSATQNGSVVIRFKRGAAFRFNMFDLLSLEPATPIETKGIELQFCDKKAHAPLSWINFYTQKGKVAFIRLGCGIPAKELNGLYNDFALLKSFCTK